MNSSSSSEAIARRNQEREERKKRADEMRKKSQRSEFSKSLRSLLKQVQDENPIELFKATLHNGSWDEIRNETIHIRRTLEVDYKMKRLSHFTLRHGNAFLKISNPLLNGKKQVESFQNALEKYRSLQDSNHLKAEEQLVLRKIVMQLRITLQNYNLLRDQAIREFTIYSQGRRKDIGEENALRHSTEFYLQFVDAPQRAKIETQMKGKMGDMSFENRIDALKMFISILVKISPSVRNAEVGRCLEMARHFRSENYISEAVAELQKALEYGESAEIYFEMAQCWRQKKDVTKEIGALNKAIQCDPSFVEPLLRMAQIREETGNPHAALQYYQKVLELRPHRFSLVERAAKIAFEHQIWKQAVQWISAVLKKKPKSKISMMRLGIALIHIDQLDRGIALLKECLRKNMEDSQIDLHLGIAYHKQKHYSEAHPFFASAVQKNPKDLNHCYWLALSEFDSGEYEEAERRCRILVNKDKNNSQYSLLHAKTLMKLGNVQEAILILESLQKDPHCSQEALVELGNGYLKTRREEEAYSLLKKVLEKEPGHEKAREILGLVCIQTGRFEESSRYMLPVEK